MDTILMINISDSGYGKTKLEALKNLQRIMRLIETDILITLQDIAIEIMKEISNEFHKNLKDTGEKQ